MSANSRFTFSSMFNHTLVIFGLLGSVLIATIYTSSAFAAGFNCDKATTNNEFLICEDPWLSKLDDHYTKSYTKLRVSISSNEVERKRIQEQAQNALAIRDSHCTSRRCLIDWYKEGRVRLNNELRTARPGALETKLTPQKLYEKLNLRSFPSMIGPQVKYHCETYLDAYFPASTATITGSRLVLQNDESYWQIDILDNSTIKIGNRSLQGSYNTSTIEKVYFDPGAEDIRVSVGVQEGGELFEIDQQPKCVPLKQETTSATTAEAATAQRARAHRAQGHSVGEFVLNEVFNTATFPVYNARKGLVIGQMTMSLGRDKYGEARPKISMASAGNKELPSSLVIYRAKYEPSLLVIDRSGNWFNLSADPKNKLWINGREIPEQLLNSFRTREYVMLNGSVIKVKSGHRLRAAPNTNSDILKVLQPNQNDRIVPLDIKGDWMRVRSITPEPIHLTDQEILDDPNFTVLEGWIKWRESAKKQYVDVYYMIGV